MIETHTLLPKRRSIRLKEYDYSQEGLYFVTLCTKGRAHLFGHVEDSEMILNDFGQIVHDEWLRTDRLRENIELGEFVTMPNHMHAIILIAKPARERTELCKMAYAIRPYNRRRKR